MRPRFLDQPHSYTRHQRTFRDLHGEKLRDDLSAAKGIFAGAVMGAVLWMLIGAGVYWVLEELCK